MENIMNNEPTVLQTRQPAITISAMKKSAATNIPLEDQLSELVDNAILVDKNESVNVMINLYYSDDNDKSFIEVTDTSIGIPEDRILDVFNLGERVNTEKFLLGKMGMGMKGAIWGLGELDYVISKTINGVKSEVRPVPYTDLNETLVYMKVKNENSFLDAQKSGTIVRIKRVNEFLPKWTNQVHFDKFMDKFNSMYATLLNDGRLNISVSYTNSTNSKSRFNAMCSGATPLMSNPRHVLDDNLDGIYIGHNEPIYKINSTEKIDGVEIKTKNTCVKLTAWHKPTPRQVELYYEKTKNSLYEPDKYKRSVFGYGFDKAGIIVKYKGKLIQFGLEKETSWESDKGVLIEISDDSGLKFTQYKNTLVMNNNYKECLDAVLTYLHEVGFRIRSLSNTQPIAEKEIVQKFVEHLKNDSIYCHSFNIINVNDQVKTWVHTAVGEADIVIYDYSDKDKVIAVIEAKKDRCGGEEARQLWGYMCALNCTRGILLTGVSEQPSFKAQIDAFKRSHVGFDIVSSNVSSLSSARFFT